jgi:predicted permease
LHRVDPGFQAQGLLTMRLQPSNRPAAELRAYWRSVLESVRALPGVTAAATILHLPMSGRSWNADVLVEGRPQIPGQSPLRTAWQVISVGYLDAARIPVVSGRDFTAQDHSRVPRVALVNEAFAASVFPGENPIGRRVRAGNATQNEWATVVGIIGSVRHDSLNTAPAPELYVPFEQRLVIANSLIVRTRGNPADVAVPIRDRIVEIDSDVPVSQIRTMEDLLTGSIARERVTLALLSSFAIIGLVLGAVGIWGVVAWSARQRSREIGIRIALGARAHSLVAHVARRSFTASLAGVAIGIVAALALVRLMRGLIFGVSPTDPITFLLVPAVMLVVAGFAAVLPAWRATRLPPASVLTDS